MDHRKAGREAGVQLHINDSIVTVMFSRSEGLDVKGAVRDILTETYEERFL